MARPTLPRQLAIRGAAVGTTHAGTVGFYARAGGTATARLLDDAAGSYRIVRVEVDEVVQDPDGPPGHPVLEVLEPVAVVEGRGPIEAQPGQALLIGVEFGCPADPMQDLFLARVLVDGIPDAPSFPLSGTTNAGLSLTMDIGGSIGHGDTKQYPYLLSSTLGHHAEVTLDYDAVYDGHFSCPSQALQVGPGETVEGVVSLTSVPAGFPVGCFATRFVATEISSTHQHRSVALNTLFVSSTPPVETDQLLHVATLDLHQYWAASGGMLTVGLPIGPVTRSPDGSYLLPCLSGSLFMADDTSKPQDGTRHFIDSIEIVGLRCYSPDDPHGDETYVVSDAYYYEVSSDGSTTSRSQPFRSNVADTDSVKSGSVVLSHTIITNGPIVVPGNADVSLSFQVWDQENGNPDDVAETVADAAQTTLDTGLGAVAALLSGAAPEVGAGAGYILGGITHVLGGVASAIGDAVADLLGDDQIGDSKTFTITADYVRRLIDGQVLERISESLEDPGITYNWPELPEDDSADGRFWLFDGDKGGGQYRPFLRITASELGPPVI